MKNYYAKLSVLLLGVIFFGTSCMISKKKCEAQKAAEAARLTGICDGRIDALKKELQKITDDLSNQLKESTKKLAAKDDEISKLKEDLAKNQGRSEGESKYIDGLKLQIEDQKQRLQQASTDLFKSQQDIDLLKDANRNLITDAIVKKTRDSLIKNVYDNLTKGLDIDNTNKDIQIKVDKAVVYVEISEKVLFKSGSYELSDKASASLEQIVKIILAKPNFDVIVEGHTDDVPYNGSKELIDNWDLSAKRATAVVRLLKNNYGVEPRRITAAGRAEFVPIADNRTSDGRSKNRRIKIIITPTLEQFGKLLESATK